MSKYSDKKEKQSQIRFRNNDAEPMLNIEHKVEETSETGNWVVVVKNNENKRVAFVVAAETRDDVFAWFNDVAHYKPQYVAPIVSNWTAMQILNPANRAAGKQEGE